MNRFGFKPANTKQPGLNKFPFEKKILTLTLVCVLATASPAFASDQDDEIRLLKAQLTKISQRLEKLEAMNNEVEKTKSPPEKKESAKAITKLQHPDYKEWPHRIAFNADLRYRQEYIDEKGKETRFRHRIRFRTGMKMNLTEDILLGFQLASGDDNPVSNNVTLDHAFSNKDIRLNKAYAQWQFNQRLKGVFGKFSNPFARPGKTPLVWDSDLIPEGAVLTYSPDGFDAVVGWFSVEERKSGKDTQLWGSQLRKTFALDSGNALKVAIGYFDYINLQGFPPLYDGKNRGNQLDAAGGYLSDFNELELLAEWHSHLFDKPFMLFGDYTRNTAAATDQDSAWTAGFKYGKAKTPGSWQISYAWLEADADSVVALFNDSDFAGGSTDAKGSLLKFKYAINKKTYAGLTYIDSQKHKASDSPVDYDRLQVDVGWKF
jgi:hypothetical protein